MTFSALWTRAWCDDTLATCITVLLHCLALRRSRPVLAVQVAKVGFDMLRRIPVRLIEYLSLHFALLRLAALELQQIVVRNTPSQHVAWPNGYKRFYRISTSPKTARIFLKCLARASFAK